MTDVAPNTEETIHGFGVGSVGSLIAQVSLGARRKIFKSFMDWGHPSATTRVLDVGASGSFSDPSVNYFERWYPHPQCITGLTVDASADDFRAAFPHSRVVQYGGTTMPFADKEFDIAFSSAVLEHVGDRWCQVNFCLEMCRVARRVFLAFPDPTFPVEFHTVIPLAHWLPRPARNLVWRTLGRGRFCDVRVLNLVSAHEFETEIAVHLPVQHMEVERVSTFGMPSNVLVRLESR